MVKFNINGKQYKFPTIEDLTVREFVDLMLEFDNHTPQSIIAALSGCDLAVLQALPAEEMDKLIILYDLLFKTPPHAAGREIAFLPLGRVPFGQFADFMQKYREYGGDFRAIPYTIAYLRPCTTHDQRENIYLPWAYSLPASVGVYYHLKISEELRELNATFAALASEEGPSEIERSAGIGHLTKYGEYLTMHTLSGGDVLKIKEIAEMPTNQIFTYLCVNKDVQTYQSEIQKLRKRNGIQENY
jgi:hypothetical protein